MTVVVIVVFFFAVWPALNRDTAKERLAAWKEEDSLLWHRAAGRRSFQEATFPLALEEFRTAEDIRKRHPEFLSGAEVRELHHLYWQSDLLANELPLPLEQLLKKADDSPSDAAWGAQFKLQFQGKSVILDDIVRRNTQGKPALRKWEIHLEKRMARVEVDDVLLLENLPLDPPQRWLFGAKLKSFAREGEEWVIRFEPASGRLLTDREALIAWRPKLLDDPTFPDLLARQERQLRQLLIPEP